MDFYSLIHKAPKTKTVQVNGFLKCENLQFQFFDTQSS